MAQQLLSLQGVSKKFVWKNWRSWIRRDSSLAVQALDDVSFTASAGQAMALLGPNGAGKTTLINIICDMVRADRGSVRVAGLPIPEQAREASRHIGLVSMNDRSFFWRLTGRQNLEFFGALYDLSRSEIKQRSEELLVRFGLASHANRLYRTYSTGTKKRLALARALLHNPQILLMDEPTSNIDAHGAEDLLDLVRTQIECEGKCVIWATHRLEEVRELCDSVAVLTAGRLRYFESVDQFLSHCDAEPSYRIRVTSLPHDRDALNLYIQSINGTVGDSRARPTIEIPRVKSEHEISEILRALLDLGVSIDTVERNRPTMAQAFEYLSEQQSPPSPAPENKEVTTP